MHCLKGLCRRASHPGGASVGLSLFNASHVEQEVKRMGDQAVLRRSVRVPTHDQEVPKRSTALLAKTAQENFALNEEQVRRLESP